MAIDPCTTDDCRSGCFGDVSLGGVIVSMVAESLTGDG